MTKLFEIKMTREEIIEGLRSIYGTEFTAPDVRAFCLTNDIGYSTVTKKIEGSIPKKENEARVIMQELLKSNSTGVISFGTEAGIFQEMEMDVVVCGPGSIDQAHKANEFISLSQLEKCLFNLLNLLDQWSARS